ncbi:MAG: phage baseplate protein, partial [Acetobacteraceae bacterium]
LTLWNPGYELGIQPSTMYARSGKSFAWYKGGTYIKNDATPIDPGAGGVTMMSLSDGVLTVSDKFTGKGAVPVGAILMWSGDPAKLPAGWALCNGANGTPPLQDRFVVGYNPNNSAYNKVGNTGGEAAHVLAMAEMPAHNHGAAGQHNHTIAVTGPGWAFTNTAQSGDPRSGDGRGNCPTTQAGMHTHAMQGEGRAHENRPPYYVLAYIMFTG